MVTLQQHLVDKVSGNYSESNNCLVHCSLVYTILNFILGWPIFLILANEFCLGPAINVDPTTLIIQS